VKRNIEFLAARSHWVLLLASSISVALVAIPVHELGHFVGYRLTGVAARIAFEHTTLPAGESFNLLGTAGGVFSTYVVSYIGIVLIYRKKWLPLSYPLAAILSFVRVATYVSYWIQYHTLAGMDESLLATLTGSNPYLWYAVSTSLFITAWILIFNSLRYGIMRNVLLCAIPVALYIAVSSLCLFAVAKYFPQTASNPNQALLLAELERGCAGETPRSDLQPRELGDADVGASVGNQCQFLQRLA
jgi:hypothetical protein